MISKEHKKHTALKRASVGSFGRNEWALLGAPCTTIKLLADHIASALAGKYKCAYADTTHNDDITQLPGRLASGVDLEYTDQINYSQLNFSKSLNSFQLRRKFSSADLVLVNGNHQQAKAQVVIIHQNKRASLQKRVSELTNVQLLLLADETTEIFDFIKEAIPSWGSLPVYKISETEKIVAFFEKHMENARPVLNGLVLAGGKSERMGFDKGGVNWHGKEQRYHMADLLTPFCDDVFISCREEQKKGISNEYRAIADSFTGLGPFGAILSAFREYPDNAWLVVACDLPLITSETLSYLVDRRNVSTIATTYQSNHDNFPEPLITIWEPKSYPVLLSFLAMGYSCPRKVLINSEITLLDAKDVRELTNVNTPDELKQVKQLLNYNTNA